MFAIFEEIESEAESDVENLLELWHRIDRGRIKPRQKWGHSPTFYTETVVHVETESNESELPPEKKLKAKIAELKWKGQPKFIKTI